MATKKKSEQEQPEVLTGEIVMREAPEQRIMNIKEIQQPSLNAAQLRMLTGQTPKWAVKTRQGRGGKAFKYVPHGYVTDTLNKAFGFDWDLEITPISGDKLYALEIERDSKGVETRHIAVSGKLIVRVHTPKGVRTITKSGFGSQTWNATMELGDALKGARSDLVKTCAYQLGIALDLYWNERAELDEFVAGEIRKTESARIAEKLTSGVPDNAILLLSRSMSEFSMNGLQVAELCGITIDNIMSASAEEIAEYWNVVKNANKK